MFQNRMSQIIAVIIMTVFLFVILIWGGINGYGQAKADAIVLNSNTLAQGLQYFYTDQNRYPTLQEFADNNLMLNYFNPFPPKQILSTNCKQNFVYKTGSYQSYELAFCLPENHGKFIKGWNSLKN